MMNINDVLSKKFVKDIREKLGGLPVIIERDASYILRNENESDAECTRAIILPPRGYTGNEIDQTNCYAGVFKGAVDYKGAVREGKAGFSKIQESLLCISFNENSFGEGVHNRPYRRYDINDLSPEYDKYFIDPKAPPVSVVKKDGTGFYHALINNSDDWLFLTSRKQMRPQRSADVAAIIKDASDDQQKTLLELERGIVELGDNLFRENTDIVDRALKLPLNVLLPALGEMLYIRDRGSHETCTAFGMILKVAKFAPAQVTNFLQSAKGREEIPGFFADQLIEKISNKSGIELGSHSFG